MAARTKAKKKDLGPGEYTPTAAEQKALDQYFDRKNARPPSPAMRLIESEDGNCSVSYDHVSQSLAAIVVQNAIGAVDNDFFRGLEQQIINATTVDGRLSEKMLNFALAAIRGAKPRDEIEVMLAAQMAITHLHVMDYSRRLGSVKDIGHRSVYETGLNKLSRTFTTQVEALKRHRSKGEQVVRVERVYIGPGGQAVVGNITSAPGGGVLENSNGQSHEPYALAAPESTALPCAIETNKAAVSQSRG